MSEQQDTVALPSGEPFSDTQRQLNFTPVLPLGTGESTATQGPNMRDPPTRDDLQAKVDIMLQDINVSYVERMREHQEKLEAQQKLNELAAKYDDIVRRLEVKEAQLEPR